MKKIITLSALLILSTVVSYGQNASGAAQQSVQLGLSNALDITFTNTSSSQGSTVTMAFNNADHYTNGVESGTQEIKIRSNKTFKVGVKIDLGSFSYVGNGNLNSAVIPSNAFQLKLVNNTTSGTIAAPFSTSGYATLTDTEQDLILNGANGSDRRFSLKYKCNPGWGMPAGTYTFDVVYTATQQ